MINFLKLLFLILISFSLESNCRRFPRRQFKLIEFDLDNNAVPFSNGKEARAERDPGRSFLNYLTKLFFDPLLQSFNTSSNLEVYRHATEHEIELKGRHIKFFLYTLNNRVEPEILPSDGTIKNSKFWNRNEKVKIFIHGYLQTANVTNESFRWLTGTPDLIRDAYLKTNRRENLVVVQWMRFAREPNYFNSVRNTFVVGQKVVDFVMSLRQEGMIQSYEDIHLIGYSLGAHTAGIAGHFIYKNTGEKIDRITGIDPAGPGYEPHVDKIFRLDKDDATFVDVIHCSSGDILNGKDRPGKLGSRLLSGDVDFFPNGGVVQPGCSNYFLIDQCSHQTCPDYFAASVRGVKYKSCPCTSKSSDPKKGFCDCAKTGVVMGEFCPTSTRGVYYVNTNTII